MLTPTAIKAPHGAQDLEITWPNGHTSRFPHRILRGYCPCAGCQGHSGAIKYIEGGNLELRDLEPVGNYALSLTWGDAHNAGIYTYQYLHDLGVLLERLGEQGLIDLGEIPR
ncbi:MAG TPA: DUF971 domain-containing protein [Polyangiaceae bacterium]